MNYIHDDGSYKHPLRSRLGSRASSVASSAPWPRTRNISTQSSDSALSSASSGAGRWSPASGRSVTDQVPPLLLIVSSQDKYMTGHWTPR